MRISVPLNSDVLDNLQRLARRERRHPRDQAAILIEAGLFLAQDCEGVGSELSRPRSVELGGTGRIATSGQGEAPLAPVVRS